MEVKQTSYGTSIDILFNLAPYAARPIMVESDNVPADSNGRKIVKAGSLLDASGRAFVKPSDTVLPVNDGTARYVLLKDVDVTAGDKVGAGVYQGTLNLDKIEANLTTDPTDPFVVSESAKAALRGIFFMTDDNIDYKPGSAVGTITAGSHIALTADDDDDTEIEIAYEA